MNTTYSLSSGEHPIKHRQLSRAALDVIKQLQQAGFDAYLVGGAIRDMFLGLSPKDFDVATNATPEQVKECFKRQARIIGRRFQIVHVRFGREIIEVTTFRGSHEAEDVNPKQNHHSAANSHGILLRDNVFGSVEEDAIRRDFTCNALYYDPSQDMVWDFTGGIEDIKQGKLKIIGDANTRFTEDPVRMLRALRFAGKLGFEIETDTFNAIAPNRHLLAAIPSARLFDESLKLFFHGKSLDTFHELNQHRLIDFLVQDIREYLKSPIYLKLIEIALRNTDRRIKQGKTITPAFLWAVFLWPKLMQRQQLVLQQDKIPPTPALHEAASQCISEQNQLAAIPKRFSTTMREIWALQISLERITGKRPLRTISHPRFRAAYDFLLLREESGESATELGQWWTEFQNINASEQDQWLHDQNQARPKKGKSGTKNHNKPKKRSSNKQPSKRPS